MRIKRLFAIILSLTTLCTLSAIAFCALADSSQNVVFVSGKGKDSNNGQSADSPVKTLSQAFKKLGGEGTIVVCGDISLSFSEDGEFPATKGTVTITSVWDGVDYKEQGARIALGTDLYINGGLVIENVHIDPSSSPKIYCQGNNVKFGDGITTGTGGRPPVIIGGRSLTKASGATVKNTQFFGYTLEINSGTWYYVNGGCMRTGEDDLVGVIGDIRLIINGGKFTATGSGNASNEIVSAVAGAGLFGDLYMEINGGEFNSSVFAIGRTGMNGSRRIPGNQGDVRMVINGGTFNGIQVSALQEPTNFLDGDFYLDINNANFSSYLAEISAKGVDGTAYIQAPSVLDTYLLGFSKNVFVSSKGNDTAQGTADAPVKTLTAAANLLANTGGRIVVCDTVSVDRETLAASAGDVIITGKLGAQTYPAALKINGVLTLGDNTQIEHLTVKCAKDAEICAGGNYLTMGAERSVYNAESKKLEGGDIKVEGDLIVSGGDGKELEHTITLNSGTYLTVRGGMSERGTAVIVNGGEYNGTIYGSGPVKNKGTSSVVINGGIINGNIYASEKGSSSSVGVSVNGGEIHTKTIGAARRNSVNCEFSVGLYGGNFYVAPTIDTRGAATVSASAADNLSGAIASIENKVNTVFVRDGGTGDGKTPATAMGDLSEAAKLIKDGGSLVICDEYNVRNLTFLSTTGNTNLTSFGGGCDWSVASKARVVLSDSITLGSDTVIDYVEFFAAENATYVAASCNAVTFGEHFESYLFEGRGVEQHVSVYGGIYSSGSGYGGNKGTDITIKAGNFFKIYGGNLRANGGAASLRTIKGDINITIYDAHVSGILSVNGMNDLTGNATLNVYGGKFYCPVFGTSTISPSIGADKGKINGDITLNLWGGEYAGNLDCSQNFNFEFNGKYTLNAYWGDYIRVASIRGTEGMAAGNCSSAINTNLDLKFDDKIDATIEFTNPIANYADPSVQYDKITGYYYYTYSGLYGGKQAIYVTRAANLCDVGRSDPILIWTSAMQEDGRGSDINSIWAPQINYIDGKWYIYATCARESSDAAVRLPYVWVGGDTPLDPFYFHGTIDNYDPEVDTYLSPRFIEYGGKRYICNGGFFRPGDRNGHQQSLFITELESPTAFKGDPVVIARPSRDYEDHKILEGPIGLVSPGGQLYMCYAAGHTRGQEYCTGIMKFLGGENDSLANPSLWEKMEDALHFVDYDSRVYSPGAMMFTFESDDETQIWAVYHAKKYTYTAYTMRRLYMQPLTWENDFPVIEDPKPVDTIFTFPANSRSVSSRISGFTSSGNVEYTPPAEPPYDTEFDDIEPIKDAPVKTSSLSLWLIIGGCAAAVGAAVAAILIVGSKKKKAKGKAEADKAETDAPKE